MNRKTYQIAFFTFLVLLCCVSKCVTAQAKQYRIHQLCERPNKFCLIINDGAVAITKDFIYVRMLNAPALFTVIKVSKHKGKQIYQLKGINYTGFFVLAADHKSARLEVNIEGKEPYEAVLIFYIDEI